MQHIVISDAFQNFESIKKEIISGATETFRAQRGGPNGHSVKWYNENDIPLTSEAIKNLSFKYIYYFTKNIPSHSEVVFEYQFIEYNQPNDQYNWHVDGAVVDDEKKCRRMTIALNLSTQNEDFTGGGFQLSKVKGFLDNSNLERVQATNFVTAFSDAEVDVLSKNNSVVIFNPDTIHRGAPIESGVRNLLTVWANW